MQNLGHRYVKWCPVSQIKIESQVSDIVSGQFCCSDNQCCNELDSYDEYYDYDYYTGTTYSDYSSTAKYEDILYHYTPYNTHMGHSVLVNDTETGGEINSENEETFENSSNVSLMITETSDDDLVDNVTLRVSDGVDIALNSDDTETTITGDVTDEDGDKWETDSNSSESNVQAAADAISDDNVSISTEHPTKEGVSRTTVKIVAMDDESDDNEDAQISATFYETISETENASETLKLDNRSDDMAEIANISLTLSQDLSSEEEDGNSNKKVDNRSDEMAEITNITLTLSQEDLSSQEDDGDSNENVMENAIEESYDEMFSTEADTAEVSAVEYIVDEYYYEQEVTLEHPIAYFEDIEDDDLFSSGRHSEDIGVLEISGSGEIFEGVSSSAEFREELEVDSLDKYIEEEKDFLEVPEETEEESSVFSAIENLFEDNLTSSSDEDETSTPVNILDWEKKEQSRHPKLISSWQEKSHSCQKLVLSYDILLIMLLSFILNYMPR